MKLQATLILTGLLLCALPLSAAEDWLLVEFSRSLPPCAEVHSNSRCWGTKADIVSFEMRSGETLTLPSAQPAPPVWVRMQRLWISPSQSVTLEDQFSITLDRTPIGARLQVQDGERTFLESVPLNQWIELCDRGHSGSVWTRVSTPATQ